MDFIKGMNMMISIFGIVSLVIFVFCAAALFFHNRLVEKRGAVDNLMAQFDDLLHERLELYVELAEDIAEDNDEIRNICEAYISAETRQIIKAWAKIQKVMMPLKAESEKDEALTENAYEIVVSVRAYNEYVEIYNRCITRFPWKIIAFAVGFKAMKSLPKVLL